MCVHGSCVTAKENSGLLHDIIYDVVTCNLFFLLFGANDLAGAKWYAKKNLLSSFLLNATNEHMNHA